MRGSRFSSPIVALAYSLAACSPARTDATHREVRTSALVDSSRPPDARSSAMDLEYGSGSDVRDLLAANGVTGVALACHNPTTSGKGFRAVVCTTHLSDAELATLTSSVPLTKSPTALWAPVDGSCESTNGFAAADPRVDIWVGKNARIPNGVGPIEIHVRRDAREACVEIHYPWS